MKLKELLEHWGSIGIPITLNNNNLDCIKRARDLFLFLEEEETNMELLNTKVVSFSTLSSCNTDGEAYTSELCVRLAV